VDAGFSPVTALLPVLVFFWISIDSLLLVYELLCRCCRPVGLTVLCLFPLRHCSYAIPVGHLEHFKKSFFSCFQPDRDFYYSAGLADGRHQCDNSFKSRMDEHRQKIAKDAKRQERHGRKAHNFEKIRQFVVVIHGVHTLFFDKLLTIFLY
jgi:hypothetical protein